MTTAATLIALAAEGAEHHGNVQAQTVGYGVVALVAFIALALVTWSYRNVANRHAHKAEAYARKNPAPTPEGHGH
jgi:heme/copper-type cytochrome/quinol oxidase subunit 2